MNCLQDLKILDFSTLLPGPFASLQLADMGAEVLKISSPSKADLVLDSPPYILGTEISANQAWLGRNKKTMSLNLKTKEAIEIVKKLVLDYDILLEQFRPGVMAKLGLGYDTLKEINPALIYCSLTGYGASGPYSNRPGHDINYLSLSGNMAYSGKLATGPVLTNMQIADIAVGSMNSIIAILAAVHYREKTGEGQFLDISMLDGLIPFHAMPGTSYLVNHDNPKREGELLNGGSFYDFYACADGNYFSVGALEPQFWSLFCQAINKEEWIKAGAFPNDILLKKAELRQIFLTKTQAEWKILFDNIPCCVEPVLNMQEALDKNEHIQARNLIVEVPLPNSTKTVKQLGHGIKFSKTPVSYRHAGYPSGFHTKDIIKQLGYSEEEWKDLEEKGVFK